MIYPPAKGRVFFLTESVQSSRTDWPGYSANLSILADKIKLGHSACTMAEQPLHGVRVAADEQSLREALGFIGGRLVARADGPITSVAISRDNRWVVTGSSDKTVRLWDLSAKDPAANPVVLRGHDDEVNAVVISPDNRWVVTGSSDKTARLWDLSAKDPAANPVVLRGHEDRVTAVAISPDNRWLVTGSADNTARLWLLQMNDLVDLARTLVGRNFSADEWQLYFPGQKYRKTFSDLPD